MPHLVHLAACGRACPFNKLFWISPSLLRRAVARLCGAVGTSTPGGELAQTLGEVCAFSLLSVCAMLRRLQRPRVAARALLCQRALTLLAAAHAGLPAALLGAQI